MKAFILKYIGFLLITILISACSAISQHAKINITAEKYVNPNIYQQAAPVVVSIYQLKSNLAFNQTNLFALINNAHAALGEEFVDKQDIEVRPNQKQQLKIQLSEHVAYIGVVAAFRNPDSVQWRQIKSVKFGKSTAIKVRLSEKGITLE